MPILMQDLDYVRAYIDDLLILSKGDWSNHLDKLEAVLQRIEDSGLKVNAKKSFFGQSELEYLGYWITPTGIQPIPKKVQAILNIQPPTKKKQLQSFIGMINYYRDMWAGRSEILAPLSKLTSKNAKWQWTEVEQEAFENIKKIISKEVLLSYPNFNLPFEIHTDASKTALGAVISQKGNPIAFYSRKLSPAQMNYTTTERELLAIVETLKEFKNILLGQQIKIYTDHQNLTYKQFNTERVMRWHLILEEYSPELIYLPGKKNIVADALSRLDINNNEISSKTLSETLAMDNAKLFGEDTLEQHIFSVNLKLIQQEQQKDKQLLQTVKLDKNNQFQLKNFRGGGNLCSLICYKDKIVVPKVLQSQIIQWYHTFLCHPGLN
jgi:hypothetical protein